MITTVTGTWGIQISFHKKKIFVINYVTLQKIISILGWFLGTRWCQIVQTRISFQNQLGDRLEIKSCFTRNRILFYYLIKWNVWRQFAERRKKFKLEKFCWLEHDFRVLGTCFRQSRKRWTPTPFRPSQRFESFRQNGREIFTASDQRILLAAVAVIH